MTVHKFNNTHHFIERAYQKSAPDEISKIKTPTDDMTPYFLPFAREHRNWNGTFSQQSFHHRRQRDAIMPDRYSSSAVSGYLPVTYSSSPALLRYQWANGGYVVTTSKFLGGRHWTRTQRRSARHSNGGSAKRAYVTSRIPASHPPRSQIAVITPHTLDLEYKQRRVICDAQRRL